MIQIKALSPKVQVILAGTSIGLVKIDENRVVLIDSGFDRRTGRRILELIGNYGYKVEAILNTHAHADHVGGNAVIQESTGCKIFASTNEAPAIGNPLMQAIALFGGAPFPELLNPFIIAEPSKAEIFDAKQIKFGETEIEIIDLPGHSIGQKGFLVDGVAFLADTLFSAQVINKHRLIYLFDPIAHIETCKRLRNLKADWYVGGHFSPINNINGLIAENLGHTEAAINFLKGLLAIPQSFDRLLKSFLTHFSVKKGGWEHFLYRATLNAYLSALKRSGGADFRVMDNLLVWYAVSN
ncbi:MAG: MBL fold metallo-hydrolase [Candidatus Riflebacteria bacterium]|nr:MBL fold metallo-hydrolase [Candidatus Riflebacteria bacterium]